jgi:hypothetical protein
VQDGQAGGEGRYDVAVVVQGHVGLLAAAGWDRVQGPLGKGRQVFDLLSTFFLIRKGGADARCVRAASQSPNTPLIRHQAKSNHEQLTPE